MTLDTLEKQVIFWNRAAILIPIFFTLLLSLMWLTSMFDIEILFFIACGLYFFTAIIWWWWTMKSVHLLVNILKKTNNNILEVSTELKNIRKDIQIDK